MRKKQVKLFIEKYYWKNAEEEFYRNWKEFTHNKIPFDWNIVGKHLRENFAILNFILIMLLLLTSG
jgi:hypothetical protein